MEKLLLPKQPHKALGTSGEQVKEYKGKFNICKYRIYQFNTSMLSLGNNTGQKNMHNQIFIPLRNDVFIRTDKY
jgi:hypothetical protein